jgi:class 3 adenylate cyclase/tetratricopeptide (TPR) repeat protein
MKCPQCQSDNREGVNFCETCGASVTVICANCNSKIPIDKNFCGECGHRLRKEANTQAIDFDKPHSYTPKFMAEKILTTRSSLEGERKLVTVFFSDVAGFTDLSEQLDPEAVHQIMDGCFKILMEEIHKYEGTINQFTGDGVMALFGAPLAHEDHAQRACLAAVGVQKSLRRYAEKVNKAFQLDFKMRIGINSGPVVVGAIGDDLRMDYTAVGDTTNLAARMESMARPGGILLSEKTYRLVNQYFNCKHLGTVPIKGKKDPQAIYEIAGISRVKSRLDASESRGLTTLIGREEELESLLDRYQRVAAGKGQVVGIVGEPGVGKSRFVFEMRHRIDDRIPWLESRCVQYGSNIPFFPIRELVRTYLGISDSAPEAEISERLDSGLTQLDKDLAPFLPAIRELLSQPIKDSEWERLDPKEKRMQMFEAIRNVFIRLGQERPMVMVLDDLQWIDKTSEEFISYFVEWIAHAHILVLLVYRHEFSHAWGSKSFYSQISIDQLSQDESRQLLGLILADGRVAPELEDLILDRTSGNPLFIEELTHTLLENSAIIKKDNQYQIGRQLSQVDVPDTIQGIIAGRMDRLEDGIKRTMQMAAVIGRNFIYRILEVITGLTDQLKSDLLILQGLEFIYEKNLFPELEYIFKNAVTRDVAYNSLLLNRREEIHADIASAFEEGYNSRLEEFYEVIAYHYQKSHDHERAVKYLKLSGDKANRNNSAFEAYAFYNSALESLKAFPDSSSARQSRLEIVHAIMSPIIVLGFPEDSLNIIQSGIEVAEKLDDRKSLIRFYSNTGFYYSSKGKHDQGMAYTQKAFDEANAINDLTAMAQTAPDLCLSNMAAGRFNEVVSIASCMVHAIRDAGREQDNFGGPAVVMPTFLCMSGFCLSNLGQFEKAESQFREGLESASKIDNLFTKTICNTYTGRSMILQGSWKRASDHFQVALEHLSKAPFQSLEALVKSGLGVVEAFEGDADQGVLLAEEALALYEEANAEWQRANILLNLGICLFQVGDYKKAFAPINAAVDVAAQNNELDYKARALAWRGRTANRLSGRSAQGAEDDIRQAAGIFTRLEMNPDLAIGGLFLGEYHVSLSEPVKAWECLSKAEKSFESMGMNYWFNKARTLADSLDHDVGQ